MQKHFLRSLFALACTALACNTPLKAQDRAIGAALTLENLLSFPPDQQIAITKNGTPIMMMGGIAVVPAADEKFCGIARSDNTKPGLYLWAKFAGTSHAGTYNLNDLASSDHPDAPVALNALASKIRELKQDPEKIFPMPYPANVKCGTPMTFKILPGPQAG